MVICKTLREKKKNELDTHPIRVYFYDEGGYFKKFTYINI